MGFWEAMQAPFCIEWGEDKPKTKILSLDQQNAILQLKNENAELKKQLKLRQVNAIEAKCEELE